MGSSFTMTQIYIPIALCGLSVASPSTTTDIIEEAAPQTSRSPPSDTLDTTTTTIPHTAMTPPINTQLIVIILIAIMLCLLGICISLIIAIRRQSQQRHKDSKPTISMRVQSVTSELQAIEGKSPSCDSADSKAVLDMAAAMRAQGVGGVVGDRMVPSDSTKSLSSMMSVTAQSQSMQFYDAQFDAQLAHAANAIMLNAGGPLRRDIPEFVPEYVEDTDAMRYVDAFHVGMNDREVSAESGVDEDDEVVLEMLTPTADGQ